MSTPGPGPDTGPDAGPDAGPDTGPGSNPDTGPIPVSLAIVSRGRPDALLRCLTAAGQLLYPAFEIVVVADPAGIAALTAAGRAGRIKLLTFDEANISAARNLAIGMAAGDVVAFIDDDAVPEPTWLAHLAAPFADRQVAAAGGHVRGRNGISFQWPPSLIDADGRPVPLAIGGDGPRLFTGRPGAAVKTEGTNMAFRREVLAGLGGFDPAFRFYLDETDLNLRLAAQGAVTALVPQAQVHHGYAASDRRRADRVPRDLTEVGASLAAFARRHGRDGAALLAEESASRRRALIAHLVAGRIEPRDLDRVLATLHEGAARGAVRPLPPLPALPPPPAPFRPFAPAVPPRGHRVLSGGPPDARALRAQAARLAAEGWIVSLYLFSIGMGFHRVRYDSAGYWEQRGGLFGRSDRNDRLWAFYPRAARLTREVARVAGQRGKTT